MIFLAVGTQLPFDRLTRGLDQWCADSGRGKEVFGQVGQLGPENYSPQHFEWRSQIAPDAFNARMESADVIVAHAGMGTIITALYMRKPVVIMARRAHLQEQRNDHQFATVEHFRERQGVFAVDDETEIGPVLDGLLAGGSGDTTSSISRFADDALVSALKSFIYGD